MGLSKDEYNELIALLDMHINIVKSIVDNSNCNSDVIEARIWILKYSYIKEKLILLKG